MGFESLVPKVLDKRNLNRFVFARFKSGVELESWAVSVKVAQSEHVESEALLQVVTAGEGHCGLVPLVDR